jgi:hypothetical protein
LLGHCNSEVGVFLLKEENLNNNSIIEQCKFTKFTVCLLHSVINKSNL